MKSAFLAAAAALTFAAGAAHAQQGAAAYDTNGDGKVTFDEFATGRGERLFSRLDTDKDGKLSAAEFTAINLGGKAPEIFAQLDVDKDGFVSKAEANAMAQASFRRADTNGDGALTPDEIEAARQRMKPAG